MESWHCRSLLDGLNLKVDELLITFLRQLKIELLEESHSPLTEREAIEIERCNGAE